MNENNSVDVKYQPVERRAIDILREYTGNNNFLIILKNRVNRGDTNLGRKVSEYVVKNYDKKVIGINKWYDVDTYYGDELQKKFLCVEKPTKIFIQKILADTDKAIHVWGKVWEEQNMSDMWVPKHSIIKPKVINVVNIPPDHWTKYDRPLFPHQISGVIKLLENDRLILADEQGVGKTTQAIIGALESKVKKILIVCPASLKLNWKKEIEMYDRSGAIHIIDGSKWISGGKWIIVNYDILKNFHEIRDRRKKDQVIQSKILDENFDLIIGDEAHLLKNKNAGRTKLFNDFAKQVKRLWLLTGTPVTNRPMDYFNLLELCNHRLARSWVGYAIRYCSGKQFYGKGGHKVWDTKGASNLDELHDNTQDIILRRRKEDVLDLPEKIIQPIYLPLRHSAEYKQIVGEYQTWAEHQKNFNLALHLAQLVKLRQFLALSKIESTIEIVENAIEEDKKVIIFTNFTETLHRLYNHFGDAAVIHHGPMTKTRREESVEKFQNDPNVKVFIGNIVSAGVGITLTAAELVVFNDLSWLPADHLQAQDRCVFGGQKVLTSDGYKNIECVEIGDMVYTHKGNFKKVINKHKHSERNKLKVDIKYFGYNLPLSVTEDHQIYVFNINKNIYEWVEAINIKPNKHMMAFNYSDLPLEMLNEIELINNDPDTFINCYGVEQRKGTKQKIKNKIHLTNELLYAFGWYIAEGWCNIDGTKKSCNISICGNLKTEKKRCENIINIISNAFELKTINSYDNKRNTIQYSIYSKQLAIHFRNWFGHKAHQKQFPEWVYNLNEEQCKNLLNGYYDGDGYKRKNTQQATTVSNKLAGQLCVLNAKLKNPITIRLNKSTGHPMWSYEHTLITKTTNTRIKNVNNCVHFPIKEVIISKIKHTTTENTVYDLTVEEDHSFVVGLSTVHNCHRIGQTKKVNVYYNIIDETLDLYLFEALMKKMKVIDTVMGDSNVDDDIFRDVIEKLK